MFWHGGRLPFSGRAGSNPLPVGSFSALENRPGQRRRASALCKLRAHAATWPVCVGSDFAQLGLVRGRRWLDFARHCSRWAVPQRGEIRVGPGNAAGEVPECPSSLGPLSRSLRPAGRSCWRSDDPARLWIRPGCGGAARMTGHDSGRPGAVVGARMTQRDSGSAGVRWRRSDAGGVFTTSSSGGISRGEV